MARKSESKKTAPVATAPAASAAPEMEQSTVTPLEKARAARKAKEQSQARIDAIAAYELAKEGNDDAKTKVARQQLKQLKFREVAVPRVKKVLKTLRRLQGITNTAQYAWSEQEAAKIVAALTKELDDLTDALQGKKKQDTDGFSF